VEAFAPDTHAFGRLWDVEGIERPSPIVVVFLDIPLRELDGAVFDLDTPHQMMQVQDRTQLGQTGLPRRAGNLLRPDIRGNTSFPASSMDKGSGPRLEFVVSFMMSMGRGRGITYRYQGSVKGGNDSRGYIPENAQVIDSPNAVDTAASQGQGLQVGERAAILEDADNNLGRGRGEGAGSRHRGDGVAGKRGRMGWDD
jgi:hypothetical protein